MLGWLVKNSRSIGQDARCGYDAVFDELSAAVSEHERRFSDLAKRLSSSQQR